MEKFIIEGGHSLNGEILPSGNKNAALPMLAAPPATMNAARTLSRSPENTTMVILSVRPAGDAETTPVGAPLRTVAMMTPFSSETSKS